MTSALHHMHKRKRIYQNLEPYPHPDRWKRMMDKMIYVVGIGGPVLTIPQLLKIWVEKNAGGVSLFTWSAYFIGSFLWLVYGLMHKEKPIIVAHVLFLFVFGFIIVGTILYS